MFCFYKTLFDFSDYEFIDNHKIWFDEKVSFSFTGMEISLDAQTNTLQIIYESLQSAVKTFMDEKKDEFVFFEPQIIMIPNENISRIQLQMCNKEKYEKFIELNKESENT
ncbi:MAG TPA: hypothetical protein VMX17_12485 [Candidatus Glassbacteria bacterium]|nr:hypothetical protein [Candidatus Glassbacteria bacterium]